MEANEMQELLRGYLNEMDMTAGLSKDDILRHLAGRDEALRTMVNEYVPEGTYQGVEVVIELIPAQAWQDAQGDAWRGAETQYVEDTESHFQDSPVGETSTGSGDASGTSETGGPGANAGEVDLGIGGEQEITGES